MQTKMKNYFDKFLEIATKEKVYFTKEERDRMYKEELEQMSVGMSGIIWIPEYRLVPKQWVKKLKGLLWR